MLNILNEKYLKYKSKYLLLKNQNQKGGKLPQRVNKEIEKIRKLVDQFEILEELNIDTIIIGRKLDNKIFKIRFNESYPFIPPFIEYENIYIDIDTDSWSPGNLLQDLLNKINISDYNLFININITNEKSFTNLKIRKSFLKKLSDDKLINFFNKITNNKYDYLFSIGFGGDSAYLVNSRLKDSKIIDIIKLDKKNIEEINEINITAFNLLSLDEFIQYLQNHKDIGNISKFKPVATGETGNELTFLTIIYDNLSDSKLVIESRMSQYLTTKNGYKIDFKIYQNDIKGNGNNPFLFYSKNHLDILNNLFNYSDYKSIQVLKDFRSKPDDEMCYVYIAFGDYKNNLNHLSNDKCVKMHQKYYCAVK